MSTETDCAAVPAGDPHWHYPPLPEPGWVYMLGRTGPGGYPHLLVAPLGTTDADSPLWVAVQGPGPADVQLLAEVFGDAITYRQPDMRACPECREGANPVLCTDHADDARDVEAYVALAQRLGVELTDD